MNFPWRTALRTLAVPFLSLLCLPSLDGEPPQLLGHLTLRDETVRAFNSYVAKTDQKNASSLGSGNFLWIDDLEKSAKESAYGKLKRGEILMQRFKPSGAEIEIPNGMVHDWEGLVFIPGVKLQDALAILQDYDHQATYFAPEVERCSIEQHSGDHYRVFMRFRRTKILTVVLNTEHDITYFHDSPTQVHSRSSAIRIAEVDNPGTKSEKEDQPGRDSGFLWRMETWWRLQEKDGGVYVQNRAVSLSRDIPTGLAWAVEPFVVSVPKESLEFTLGSIRRVVVAKAKSTQRLLPSSAQAVEGRS